MRVTDWQISAFLSHLKYFPQPATQIFSAVSGCQIFSARMVARSEEVQCGSIPTNLTVHPTPATITLRSDPPHIVTDTQLHHNNHKQEAFRWNIFYGKYFSIASVNVLRVKYLFSTKRTQQRQCEPVYSNHEQNSFVGFQFICKQIPLNENQKLQKYFRKCKCKMFLYWKIYISEMQIKLPFS